MTVFHSIISHPGGDPTIDLQISPNRSFLLALSPTSISILKSNNINAPIITKLKQTSQQNEEYGCFIYCSWMTNKTFICFTTLGKIIFCSFENSRIALKVAVLPPKNSNFTAAIGKDKYIFGGDDQGNLIIMSPELMTTKIYKICNQPIKKIYLANHNCLLQCADGSLYTFLVTDEFYTTNSDDQNSSHTIDANKLPFNGSVISAHSLEHDSYFSIYDVSGHLHSANLSNNTKFKSVNCHQISTIVPYNDSLKLHLSENDKFEFLIGPSRISKFSYFDQKLTDIERSNIPDCLCAIASRDILYISSTKGILLYQLLKHAENNYYYTQTAIYETKLTSNGLVTICNNLDDQSLAHIKGIEYVAAGKSHIACFGNCQIVIYNQSSNKWYKSTHPELHPIGACWCNINLCVLNYFEGTFSLIVLKPSVPSGLEMHFAAKLDSKPYWISADSSIITIGLKDSIFITREDSKKLRARLPPNSALPKKIIPCFSRRLIFTLLEDNTLLSTKIGGMKTTIIAKGIVDFFVDESLNVLTLANTKNELAFCFLNTLDDIIVYGKYDGIPIYQFQSLPMVALVLETDLLHPYLSEFNYQLYSKNIEQAPKMLSLIQQYGRFTTFVSKLASDLVLTKSDRPTIEFLKKFPEIFGHSPSDYFAFFTASEKQTKNELTTFVSNSIAFFDASGLLKYIMDEEGPNVAYPAAILLLRQNIMNPKYANHMLKYLKPVFEKGEGISQALILYFENSFVQCLIDSMKKYRPDIALALARKVGKPLSDYLKDHKNIDSSFDVITLLDRLTEGQKNEIISKRVITECQVQMMRSNWVRWLIAFLAIDDRRKDVLLILGKRPKIKESIKNSKYSYLLDID